MSQPPPLLSSLPRARKYCDNGATHPQEIHMKTLFTLSHYCVPCDEITVTVDANA